MKALLAVRWPTQNSKRHLWDNALALRRFPVALVGPWHNVNFDRLTRPAALDARRALPLNVRDIGVVTTLRRKPM